MNIAINISDKSLENQCVINYCKANNIEIKKYRKGSEIPKDCIVVGDLKFTKEFMKLPIPDYYPEFVQEFLYRKVWKTSEFPIGQKVFIKPADVPKRFNGFITNGTYHGKKKPPYWCSEVVKFRNEYRLYIQNSKIVYCGWYSGENSSEVLNTPTIRFPNNWCGSLDFGIYYNNRAVLIEAGEPFSNGWYGSIENGNIYAEWLITGWKNINLQ